MSEPTVLGAAPQEPTPGNEQPQNNPTPPPKEKPWYEVLGVDPSEIEKAGIKTAEDVKKVIQERLKEYRPEDYELPKGWEQFAEEAAKLKLTPAQAKQLADNFVESQKKIAEMQKRELDKLMSEWGDEAEENINTAKTFIKKFDEDGSFTSYLNATGAGSDPLVVRFIVKVAKQFAEHGFLQGNNEPTDKTQKKDAAEILYPTMQKKEG